VDTAVTLSDLYNKPSIEHLRRLTQADFDAFLVELFELAGFQVHKDKEAGTLYLSHDNRVMALAFISFGTERNVGHGIIDALRRACSDARAQNGLDVFGIMLTRTGYAEDDLAANHDDPPLVLLNGDQLLRYRQFLTRYRLAGHRFPPVAPTLMPFIDSDKHIYEKRPNVLAIANNRGGIGKSTTALNVAFGLAEKGKSVLAIDLDPQANFTEMLGGHVGSLGTSHIGRYFVNNAELPLLVHQTPFPRIKLVPGHPDMSKAVTNPEHWLPSHFRFAHVLRHPSVVMHPQAGDTGFEWVVIDTSPDMGFYTQAAITAANYILAPTFPSRAGNTGIEILVHAVSARRELTGVANHAKFIGFVATRYSHPKASAGMREDYEQLKLFIAKLVGKDAFADPRRPMFLPMSVPDTPRIASMTRDLIKATQDGQPFQVFQRENDWRNDAGTMYERLVEEVLKRARLN
jgi:cellulose biosynthesis protein BcsQ